MGTTKDSPDLALNFVEIASPRVWMSTSYNSDYTTNTKPSAKLDIALPLSGWYDCGSIKAVRIPVTKEIFEYKAGLPQTSRKQWEVGRTAQISFNTAELNPYVEAFMLGQSLYNTLSGDAYAVGSTYGQCRETAKLSGECSFSVNDLVVCGSRMAASLETNLNIAVVESLTGSVIALADSGFPSVTASATNKDVIQKVDAVEFIDYMGVDTVRSMLLFWDTYVDSDGTIQIQHVMYFPKVRNYSGSDMDFKDSVEPYDMGITLSAQAVNMTYGDSSTGYNFYKKWVFQY